jgi:hypothetical protein
MSGPLFENFCVQEAVKAALNRGEDPQFYYLRTLSGLEVDMLAVGRDGKLIPFEFKLAQTPRREMASSLGRFAAEFAELGIGPAYVVSLSDRRDSLTREASLLPLTEIPSAVTG